MIIVSDTSVISNLVRIGKENILHQLFDKIIIPEKVFAELSQIVHIKQTVEQLEWIAVHPIKNNELYHQFRRDLDPGESEAIVLAIELNANLLMIDERKGRRVAIDSNLKIVGLLGILIEAKEQGLLKEIKPFLDKLIAEIGFRVKPSLYAKVLKIVDEL